MHRILICVFSFLMFSAASYGQSAGVQCITDRIRSITMTEGGVQDVVVVNGIGYCLTSDLGIMAYDLSDPDHPQLINTYPIAGNPQNITIHDGLAFVSTAEIGVRIIDISDIHNPVEISFIDSYSPGRCVIYENTLVLTGGFVYTYDIHDPSNPVLLDSYNVAGSAWDAVLYGHFLIVGTGGWGMTVLDLSDPSNIQFRQRRSASGDNYDVETEGDHLYVANRLQGLLIYDIAEDGYLELAGSLDIAEDSSVNSLDIENGVAFVSGTDLTAVDVSNPESPEFLMRYSLPNWGGCVVVSQQTAFVGTHEGELIAYDVSTPITPIAHRLDGPNWSYNLDFYKDTLYIANYYNIAVSAWPHDPTAETAYYGTPGYALDMDIEGEYLYVADGDAGLSIFRLDGPDGPELVSSSPSQWAFDIDVHGGSAIILDEDAGLMIYDVSDPTAPILVTTSEVQMDSYRLSLHVSGEDIFVGHGTFVSNYKINSSQQIIHLDKLTVGQYPYEIQSFGNLLVVANGYQGILFINRTDPRNLFIEEQLQVTPYYFHSVHWDGTQLLAAMGDDGFSVFDTSDMNSIEQIAEVNTMGFSNSIVPFGSNIYLSDYQNGVLVIDNSPCPERCLADWNSDGKLNFFDITAFIEGFISQSTEADLNTDGRWNFFDISLFLKSYLSGCSV